MPKPSQSAMLHHLSHTVNTQRLYKSSLRFLSVNDAPHIHLTIIHSPLENMQIFSLHHPQFFPFIWYEYGAPQAVRKFRMGENSLNLVQAHLTLTLTVSFTGLGDFPPGNFPPGDFPPVISPRWFPPGDSPPVISPPEISPPNPNPNLTLT